MAAQFGDTGGLTRKQKEELEEQRLAREKEQAEKALATDQSKADMERLAEIRKKREEAAKKREEEKAKAEADAAAASKGKKEESDDEVSEAALKIAEIAKSKEGNKVSLNFLNQDNNCKKVLKPLLKKEGCKSMNKAWLQEHKKILEVIEEGKEVFVKAKDTK
eukprot:SRR837773.9098.p3 GENE.SRR837773.9098~~SRR837773.9098.p3  ORF type:complete len:163 (+),score=89.02 SRR837773.9098:320-808(+)